MIKAPYILNMSKQFKLEGEGSVYKSLLNMVEQISKEDLLIIASNNLETINENLIDNDSRYVVVYSELTVKQLETINNKKVLFGFICGSLNKNHLIIYGGNKETYNYINKLTDNSLYYDIPHKAALLNSSANGIHYTYLLAYYVGIVLCKKYNMDINEYFKYLAVSIPELCEGAYRNIWKGLADENSYEDVDDVIHGMEMLVCQMKKTKGKELIYSNEKVQEKLNKILNKYWKEISTGGTNNG